MLNTEYGINKVRRYHIIFQIQNKNPRQIKSQFRGENLGVGTYTIRVLVFKWKNMLFLSNFGVKLNIVKYDNRIPTGQRIYRP